MKNEAGFAYEAWLRHTEKLSCASLHASVASASWRAAPLHIDEVDASFSLALLPKVCYNKIKKGGAIMKKVLISLFLLISTLMLSSCQVNWFGSHFDVPWYFIAVPVFVLFIVLYVIIVSKTYVCPKCKTEFKPKWYQIYITIHFNDSRIAKCPNCGRKGFCKRKD